MTVAATSSGIFWTKNPDKNLAPLLNGSTNWNSKTQKNTAFSDPPGNFQWAPQKIPACLKLAETPKRKRQ
jgi:hypothetical protein